MHITWKRYTTGSHSGETADRREVYLTRLKGMYHVWVPGLCAGSEHRYLPQAKAAGRALLEGPTKTVYKEAYHAQIT
jgi:hypothetical protein